jgi:hypothetical protein
VCKKLCGPLEEVRFPLSVSGASHVPVVFWCPAVYANIQYTAYVGLAGRGRGLYQVCVMVNC